MTRFRLAAMLIPLSLGWTTAAAAQDADPAAQTEQLSQSDVTSPQYGTASQDAEAGQPEGTEKKWQFSTVGYGWLARADGVTDVIGPAQPVDLSLSVGDVISSLKFVFMGAAEARHDRFVIFGDLTFIHLEADDGIGIRDPDFLEVELDTRTVEVTLLGGYSVVDKESLTVDLMAGGRLNWFKTSLQLEGPNNSAEGTAKQFWIDPIVAARVGAPLGGKWSMSAYGDIGGIVAGSDVTWQLVGTVDYQIKPTMHLGAGWRAFKVHFDEGDFLYDVAQHGPVITFKTDW